jgi:hypothetical protein
VKPLINGQSAIPAAHPPYRGGIDQLTHADDLLVNFTSWPTLLMKVYAQQLNITGESR